METRQEFVESDRGRRSAARRDAGCRQRVGYGLRRVIRQILGLAIR